MNAIAHAEAIAEKLNAAPTTVSGRTYRARVWASNSGDMVRIYVADGGKEIGYLEVHRPDDVGYAYITGAKAALRARVQS